MLFSQRKGLKLIKNILQVDSMDADLRNGLWNVLCIYYWDHVKSNRYESNSADQKRFWLLFDLIWIHYFKLPKDTMSLFWNDLYKRLRKVFFQFEWNEVYDFIEFVAKSYPAEDSDEERNEYFMKACNAFLRRELSAYRFVGGKITQITEEEEIAEIEKAIKLEEKPVRTHLQTALKLLGDRKEPDYRNSIKESISAVESLCNSIKGGKNATLGEALKEIDKSVALHPAIKKGFDSLYGWTSDADGIRHALMDLTNLDFEDAKFMLVACSAFINYLTEKSVKAGIKL